MSSATPQIVKGTTFDSSQVDFAPVKVNSAGGKNARLQYAGGRSALYVSTPLMKTWGVNEYVDEKSGRKTYDLSLQFNSEDYMTDDEREFMEAFAALEAHLKAAAVTKSKEWFNKPKMSSEVVDALWTPMLRYPKDRETGEIDTTRSPALRVKLPFWDEQFSTEVYDVDGNAMFPADGSERTPPDLITKGSEVAAVIQSGGVWFANGKFGTTWKLFQVVVKPRATLRGKCQITLSSTDKAKMSKSVERAEEREQVAAATADVVDSESDASGSDEEEEEAAAPREPSPEPAPAPKKVKKVVKRRVVAAA